MRYRTWPVFLVGLGSLLALMFLPGLTALRKTQEIYDGIRRIQESYQRTSETLNEIERRMYLVSVLVRELLLDSSPVNNARYRQEFQQSREAIARSLVQLKRLSSGGDSGSLRLLDSELDRYWASLAPVFDWTPEQRAARGTYFLREQQRLRRQSILTIAEETGMLARSAYRQQFDRINDSQRQFRHDIERMIVLAFCIGVAIAGASIVRMSSLEHRAELHRCRTEQAEDQLRNLSTQLMHAQEEERKSISRELHDEVGQMLTGLRMELGSLDRVREMPDAFHQRLTDAKSLAEQCLRVVRDLAVGLRPSVLDLGLIPALQWQARHFAKRSGIRASVHTDGEFDDVPETHSTCIYRIVQEALTNSARHSGARAVEISVRQSDGSLDVRIDDDGHGFRNGSGARHGGLGLVGMEQRVRELGGALRIQSSESGATLTVHLSLPDRSTA